MGIFKECDIRGIAWKEIALETANAIGRSFGIVAAGPKVVCVGRDGRESSQDLAESLIRGLTAVGRDVLR